MNVQTCLQKLKLCGVLSFATVDKTGAPQIRCVSAIHYERDSLYFSRRGARRFAMSCCPTDGCRSSLTHASKK